jgi:hypothetical protein
MSVNEIVVAGTLKPDGTLELDQNPNLPPCRVQVVLRQQVEPVSQPPSSEQWRQRILETAGKWQGEFERPQCPLLLLRPLPLISPDHVFSNLTTGSFRRRRSTMC